MTEGLQGGFMSTLPTNLPSIADARLPATYESARAALETCARIDECAEWANRAEAMASYAKQAGDDSLRKMADRIQARAIQRCGALLREIQPQPGKRTDLEPDMGAPTRFDAARAAGLSRGQMVTALRVAAIPTDEFERLVESDAPPTVTALAERGKAPRLLADRSEVALLPAGVIAQRTLRNPQRAPLAQRMTNAFDQLENAVECLAQFVDEPGVGEFSEAPGWLDIIAIMRERLAEVQADLQRRIAERREDEATA
jgi:hypothetical protein